MNTACSCWNRSNLLHLMALINVGIWFHVINKYQFALSMDMLHKSGRSMFPLKGLNMMQYVSYLHTSV